MLTFPAGVRLYLATAPADLRKSFDGLSTLVQGELEMSPHDGDLFIFLNRRATQVRILFWDRDGFVVLAKRLEQGTFRRIRTAEGGAGAEIDAGELAMLLEGIDAKVVRRRKRYKAPKQETVFPENPLLIDRGMSMHTLTDDSGCERRQ